jgi:hypothetical protein
MVINYPKSWNGTKLIPTPNPKALIINIFALSAIENTIIRATRGLSLCVALPFILKSIVSQKRRIMKIQIFHHAKIESSKKIL